VTYLDALILGLIQGLTEFLPVSSSGHLVLAEEILGVKQPGVAFEVLVHLGTLVAVTIYYRRRLWALGRAVFDRTMGSERKMILYLIIGTIPAGLAGVLLEDFFERTFGNPIETSIELIITGVILLITRYFLRGKKPVAAGNALIMGVGQAVAIFPGISRSGTTIAAGIFRGVSPAAAAEFSFLLSIPAIAGAIVLKVGELSDVSAALLGPYAAATVTSFVFGWAAVSFLLAVIRRGKLDYFAYYCFAAGALGLYIFL